MQSSRGNIKPRNKKHKMYLLKFNAVNWLWFEAGFGEAKFKINNRNNLRAGEWKPFHEVSERAEQKIRQALVK